MLSTVFGLENQTQFSAFYEDDDPVMDALRFLDYRYIRFIYHPQKDKFVLNASWSSARDIKSIRVGLGADERLKRNKIFGLNVIDIEQKSMPQLLFDEVGTCTMSRLILITRQAFHPFYVFQIASLILWSVDEYYYYAGCIFFISVVSITTTLLDTRAVSTTFPER